MKKLIYVTGAGRGIGRAVALGLIEKGFEVAGCARSLAELEETKSLSGGLLRIQNLDVRDYQAVENWIMSEEKNSEAIPWGLVTAAGIYGPIGAFIDTPWKEWTNCVDVNVYGTLIPCQIFARRLSQMKNPGRIVMLSGGGATKAMENLTGYCATKTAIVRFGETLAKELKTAGIAVNSIAPGLIKTRLHDEVFNAGPEKAGKEVYDIFLKQKDDLGQTPEKAVNLISYLMTEQAANVSGRLISAIWDEWDKMHKWDEKLVKSNIFTLGRILPQEH